LRLFRRQKRRDGERRKCVNLWKSCLTARQCAGVSGVPVCRCVGVSVWGGWVGGCSGLDMCVGVGVCGGEYVYTYVSHGFFWVVSTPYCK